MAISKLLHILSGLVQTVDLAAQELQVLSITVGGASGTNLTKSSLDGLISNSHASGSDNQNVTAGDGLTGGGSGATPTLAVGAGDGISVSADAVSVNLDGTTLSKSGSGLKVNSIANDQIAALAAIALNKLAAVTASKVLVSDSSGFIAASSVSSTTLSYLDATSSVQTQLDAKLPKSGGTMSGAIDMGGSKITTLGTPTASGDATTKAYVDALVVTGGRIKEAVLISEQLSDAQGILAAEVIDIEASPIANDTIILTDGTNTETFTFKVTPSVAFDVAIGSTHIDAMTNLAAAINTDSVYWSAKYSSALVVEDPDGVVVVYDKTSTASPSTSRIYGVWDTQASCVLYTYNGDIEYTSNKTESALPASDPGAVRFGFNRQIASLIDGEMHVALEDNSIKSWNHSLDAWVTVSSVTIPDATSASGGGTKGKVTFDSDKGLSVTSGVASVKVDASSIDFGTGGAAGKLIVKASGVTNDMLAGSIADSKLSTISTSNKVSGSAVQLKADSGLADDTGLKVVLQANEGLKVSSSGVAVDYDNSSIAMVSNKLAVKASGITNDMLAGSIADGKLSTISTANKVSGSAVQLNAAGALQDSTGLAVKIDNSTIGINGSNQLYLKDGSSVVSAIYVTLTNNTGSAIPAGSVVILSQTTAGEIELADSDAIATCEGVVGVVLAEIADEASGKVQVSGEATVLKDGNFDLGKRVYVSGTAGNATKTAPSAANSVIYCLGSASATDKVILQMNLVGIN